MVRLVILVAVLFAGNVYLAVEFARERSFAEDLQLELAEQATSLAQAEGERNAFENALKALDLNDPFFLEGHDVIAGQTSRFAKMESGALYVVDPRCRWSAENVPLMNELYGAGAGSVIGISFSEDRTELAAWAESAGVEFPLLSHPAGGSLDAVPRHATPITMILHRGRVLSYIAGRVEPEAVQHLRSAP